MISLMPRGYLPLGSRRIILEALTQVKVEYMRVIRAQYLPEKEKATARMKIEAIDDAFKALAEMEHMEDDDRRGGADGRRTAED